MEINHPSNVLPGNGHQSAKIRDKNSTKDGRCLLEGKQGAPDCFQFSYSQGGEGTAHTVSRHRHNSEHFRHPLEGEYVMSPDCVIPAGWVCYVPESAWYGPQLQPPNVKIVISHCGGPSGQGLPTLAEKYAATDALKEKGTFNQGKYSWVDENGEKHNQDSFEAIFEEWSGKKIVYPPARYDNFVLMNPENFSWIKDEESPGVATKLLGSFTERDTRTGFIHLEPSANLSFGKSPSTEIIFLESGEVTHDGTTHGPLTAFGTSKEEAPQQITATKESVFWYVKLPTF